MKVYLINMASDADRLEHMSTRFDALGIDWERCPAIDMRTCPAADIDAFRNERSHTRRHHDWSRGQIGNLQSQMAVWRQIGDGVDAWGAVFEDDVHLDPRTATLLADDRWPPRSCDLVRFETTRQGMRLGDVTPTTLPAPFALRRLQSGGWGTAAYAIHRDVARWRACTQPRLQAPTDWLLFHSPTTIAARLVTMQLIPAPCIQDQYLPPGESQSGFVSATDRDAGAATTLWNRLRPSLARIGRPLVRSGLWITLAGLATFRPAQAVVQKTGYGSIAAPTPSWQASLCRQIGFLPPSWTETYCKPPGEPLLSPRVDAFISHLTVDAVGRSRAIVLTFTDENPQTAAIVLNQLITSEEGQEQDLQGAQLDRTANWLETRATDLQRRWSEAERRVSQFRIANGLTQTAAGGGAQPLILQQIADATTTLSQAQTALSAATAKASTLQKAARTDNKRSLVRMSEQPVISAAAVSLNDLYLQRSRILQLYGPDYPATAAIGRQIAQAETSLNGQIDATLQAVRSDVVEKQAQVSALQQSLDRLRDEFSGSNAKESQIGALESEAKAAQLSYQAFLTQSQRFIGRSDIQQSVTSVIAYAYTPEQPSFPRKSRFLLAAALVGMAAGIALAFMRENLQPSFTEISRIGSAVSFPLIATIERVKARSWRNPRAAVARYVGRRPTSVVAEAARSIVAAIALGRTDPSRSQVVALASATSNEGKSALSIWLASVVAMSGHRVLVIDYDHRAGTVARSL